MGVDSDALLGPSQRLAVLLDAVAVEDHDGAVEWCAARCVTEFETSLHEHDVTMLKRCVGNQRAPVRAGTRHTTVDPALAVSTALFIHLPIERPYGGFIHTGRSWASTAQLRVNESLRVSSGWSGPNQLPGTRLESTSAHESSTNS